MLTNPGARSAVSVALCTYNGERYLPAQLESLERQTEPPSQVVICDDASADRSVEIAREFARRAPFEVQVHSNPRNLGSTRNFEQAIRLCSGGLIALCDQDDVWLPAKLARLAAHLNRNPQVAGVFCDAELMGGRGESLGRRLSEVTALPRVQGPYIPNDQLIGILLRRSLVTGATLMLRATARELFLPIPTSWVHDGWISWMLALYSRMGVVNEPLIRYRLHPGQQVGLAVGADNVRALLKRLARAKEYGRRPYVQLAGAFGEVRRRWVEKPGEDYERILGLLDGKIGFLRRRAALPANPLIRALRISSMLGDYARYDKGLVSAGRDLLLSK